MDFDAITETQQFWKAMHEIPVHHDIVFDALDTTTDLLEEYRDTFDSIDQLKMTPKGSGDIGEIKDAVMLAYIHAMTALSEIKSVENLIEEIKEEQCTLNALDVAKD